MDVSMCHELIENSKLVEIESTEDVCELSTTEQPLLQTYSHTPANRQN